MSGPSEREAAIRDVKAWQHLYAPETVEGEAGHRVAGSGKLGPCHAEVRSSVHFALVLRLLPLRDALRERNEGDRRGTPAACRHAGRSHRMALSEMEAAFAALSEGEGEAA